ncbi:MAG TPA: hypothetical protein VMO00_11575, partial [Methylomirabilota bacterium]|nr:hypothetical protein [Methylomirabilota bacterium]
AFCRTNQAGPGEGIRGAWLGKLSADGSRLLFGTYTGSTSPTACPRTHAVVQDRGGKLFIGVVATNWPVTPGAYQTKYHGGRGDFALAKFSPLGSLLAATFIGGSGFECNGPDTISLDAAGNLLITGGYEFTSVDYPVTPSCLQPVNANPRGVGQGVFSLLSNDLNALLYSTYMGGSGGDMLRANCVGPDGTLYVAGNATSTNFPTRNACQTRRGANNVIAKFSPHL